jgi:transposase-like protein
MVCPRCRVEHNVLRYVPMGMIEEFRDETNPIYKCPSCRWVFSPIERAVL